MLNVILQTSHICSGSPPETLNSGPDSRSQPSLLLHFHQLPQERVGAANVDEPQQEVVDGRPHSHRLQRTLSVEQGKYRNSVQ